MRPILASSPERALLLASLLVMLNLPLIFTGMDQYGFFTVSRLAARPLPLALAASANIGLALLAYAVHGSLSGRNRGASAVAGLYKGWRPFRRNALLFGAPVALAMTPSFLLTSYGGKLYFVVVAFLITGALCSAATLKDPEMQLDPTLARILCAVGAAAIMVMSALTIGVMLLVYSMEQPLPVGNFFWRWEFSWSDLGYPPEQFAQRQRGALLCFTLTGIGYMVVAHGSNMLRSILYWTNPRPAPAPLGPREEAASPQWAETLLDRPEEGQAALQEEPAFGAWLNGHEAAISRSQYEGLVADKDHLLQEAGLLVDKISGNVFAKAGDSWEKVAFRGRQGPFLLLCVYARHPGRRFTMGELETLLRMELPDREDFNVSDFFTQLQRKPHVPVERDADGSYIPESVKVCLLDYRPKSWANWSPPRIP